MKARVSIVPAFVIVALFRLLAIVCHAQSFVSALATATNENAHQVLKVSGLVDDVIISGNATITVSQAHVDRIPENKSGMTLGATVAMTDCPLSDCFVTWQESDTSFLWLPAGFTYTTGCPSICFLWDRCATNLAKFYRLKVRTP